MVSFIAICIVVLYYKTKWWFWTSNIKIISISGCNVRDARWGLGSVFFNYSSCDSNVWPRQTTIKNHWPLGRLQLYGAESPSREQLTQSGKLVCRCTHSLNVLAVIEIIQYLPSTPYTSYNWSYYNLVSSPAAMRAFLISVCETNAGIINADIWNPCNQVRSTTYL